MNSLFWFLNQSIFYFIFYYPENKTRQTPIVLAAVDSFGLDSAPAGLSVGWPIELLSPEVEQHIY